jgi:parallel beta helix pectate lyase-like protein
MNRIFNTHRADRRRGWRFFHLHALPLLTLLPLGLACRGDTIADATEETAPQTETGSPALGAPQAVILPGPIAAGCPSSGYTRLVAVSTASQLASALSNAQPGDQIRLAAGTYRGRMSLYRAGTAGARITLCGMPGAWPVVTGGRFRLSGSFITVTGLVFAGPNGSDVNVYMASPHDILFTHNEVRNSDWHAGVSVEGSYNVTIAYNYFHDNGGVSGEIDHGIYYRAQKTTPTTRNLIANNIIVRGVGRGISMHDNGGGAISYTTVTGNTIVRNGSTGILVAVNAGLGNVIANNVLADNGIKYNYKQIRIKTGTGHQIINNIVWSPTASRSGIEQMVTGNTVTGNLTSDPLFVSNYSDLHLRSGSPAMGLALPTYSVSPDYDGTTRDGSPSAGAYEQ